MKAAETPLERLRALGLELPEPPAPKGWYVPVVQSGNLVFVSGQLPMRDGKVAVTGMLGGGISVDGDSGGGISVEAVSIEQGRTAARLCMLNVLAALEGNGVPLSSIRRAVKVTGFVCSAPDFHDQPQVLNAASELLTDVFGDAGRHARAAVGVSALPLGAAVEVEAIFEVGN